MDGVYTIVDTEILYAGWTRILCASVRIPSGHLITREIEDHGAAVCVLPYNQDRRKAVLVRQFRASVSYAGDEPVSLEAIAGLLEQDEPLACVRREAMEEAGLVIDNPELLFSGWTMPGLSTERMHFFLATYQGTLRPVPGGVAEEHEYTVPTEIGLDELARMADSGRLSDVKTLLLLQTLRLRSPGLFAA